MKFGKKYNMNHHRVSRFPLQFSLQCARGVGRIDLAGILFRVNYALGIIPGPNALWSSHTKRKRKRRHSIGFLYYPVNLPHQVKAMTNDVAFQFGLVPI